VATRELDQRRWCVQSRLSRRVVEKEYFTSIAFRLGALMFYYLFYQSRLIPRWLSTWGLAGAILYLLAPLLDMFGHGFGVLMAPQAVQEIVLAVWLITRGLHSPELSIVGVGALPNEP
jgi:hypothetical protein